MITLPYGQGTVQFTLSNDAHYDTILPPLKEGGVYESDMIEAALANPIGSPPLRELADGRRNAVVLVSDGSRLCPTHRFTLHILDELNAAGIPDERIRIVVAIGLHRRQTTEELIRIVGEPAYRRVEVLNHSADEENCRYVGTTTRGTPVSINRIVVEADFRIATGGIEPHRLAGMSGGVKALVPGVAAERTIHANHALARAAGTIPGEPENPVRHDLEEAAAMVPIHFLFNVIVSHDRTIVGAVAGHAIDAHRRGTELAKQLFFCPSAANYPLVIVSAGGHPKDLQLYQAVKSLQNAAEFSAPGGNIVLLAECSEGIGNPALQHWLDTIPSRREMIARLDRSFRVGPHKIEHIDHILRHRNVFLYSKLPETYNALLGFEPMADLQHTVVSLSAETAINPSGLNKPGIAIIPYGAITYRQAMESDDISNGKEEAYELDPLVT